MIDINSCVCKHAKSEQRMDWDNKEILDKAKDWCRLFLKEMLLIFIFIVVVIETQEDSGAALT